MTYKKFLRLYLLILCPFILINVISTAAFIYNPKLFYFRSWEYFKEVAYKFSQYEARWDANETSDLTRKNFFYYQDPHRTYVSVDKDGFRKNYAKNTEYEILISGDSTIYGLGLSDKETLPWKISEDINLSVFNGGKSSLYNTLLRSDLSKLKIIIDCRTERAIKKTVFNSYDYKKGNNYQALMTNEKNIFDILSSVPPQRFLATSIAIRVAGRIANDAFIFLSSSEEKYKFKKFKHNKSNLDSAVQSIVKRKKEVEALGIEYIFVVIPGKQSIYGKNVDLFTKNYINPLTDELENKGVKTINLLNVFITNKDQNLYHYYDTHWNAKGAEIAAPVITDYLVKNYDFVTKK